MTQQLPKLLICGTGRAGTTLLMRILTRAGEDTGFGQEDLNRVAKNIGRAGLEKEVSEATKRALPQVLKSPHLVDVLSQLLYEKWFEIGLALIPVRDLEAASQSRIRVHEEAVKGHLDPNNAPGGLWKTTRPSEQKKVLAEQFYKTVEPLVAFDVPFTLISFPRFATDIDYFDAKVARVLEASMGFDRAAILTAFEEECRPEMIMTNTAST